MYNHFGDTAEFKVYIAGTTKHFRIDLENSMQNLRSALYRVCWRREASIMELYAVQIPQRNLISMLISIRQSQLHQCISNFRSSGSLESQAARDMNGVGEALPRNQNVWRMEGEQGRVCGATHPLKYHMQPHQWLMSMNASMSFTILEMLAAAMFPKCRIIRAESEQNKMRCWHHDLRQSKKSNQVAPCSALRLHMPSNCSS